MEKIVKLLSLAARETTPEGEALNALRLASRLLENQGLDFASLASLRPAAPPPSTMRTPSRWQEMLDAKNQENEQLKVKVNALMSELTKVKQTASKAIERNRREIEIAEDGSVSYGDFLRELWHRTNRCRGALTVFSAQTGIPATTVSYWSSTGRVPAYAVEALLTITRPVSPDSEPTPGSTATKMRPEGGARVVWTPDKIEFIEKLKNDGVKHNAIATQFAEKYGHKLKPNAIARMLFNSRHGMLSKRAATAPE